MNIPVLINKITSVQKRSALAEHDAKALLAHYGIPVVPERLVSTLNEALDAAGAFEFPVVLKGHGAKLLHKTEMGLVQLNLYDRPGVAKAFETIGHNSGDALEGILVQPQLAGRRELVAGLLRDPQFGPVIMFGLGGIFTEALADVVFRLAPLSRTDAAEMINGIGAQKILNSFRGEAAVDREQLVQILMSLSRLAMELPMVAEVDINPLLVNHKGQICAVDALVMLDPPAPQKTAAPPVAPEALKAFFYPKSIAFVGASAQMGKWGHMLPVIVLGTGYKGPVYMVNPKGGAIVGHTAYKSLADIPAPVDLAVVTIPAALVPDLIPQMQAKGMRHMLLITSGFGETGAAGKSFEQELVAAARAAGIYIFGPNTMGVLNPHSDFYCTGSYVQPRPGATAITAQSGNMGTQLLAFAEQQGIGIRAYCGSGNEAMITIEDFLEAFECDELTRVVMLYVESVKNGPRFFESARRVTRKKPVVLLKGGCSHAGNRAAASHTGALSSDVRIFNGVCRQAGIVQVQQPMDLLDLAAAFSSLPLPKGKRVGIVTLGGGWGVVTSDLCAAQGLEVPDLTDSIVATLDDILPAYWSRTNPVDIVGEFDLKIPCTAIEALLAWEGCDAVINLGIMGRRNLVERLVDSIEDVDPSYTPEFLTNIRQELLRQDQSYVAHIVALMEKYQKPVYGVSLVKGKEDQTIYRVEDHHFKGVFYETPERAVKALARMAEYGDYLDRSEE